VKTVNEVRAEINRYSPGNTVEVSVNRVGDTKTFKVELKNDQGTTAIIKNQSASDILGAELKEISAEAKKAAGVSNGLEVVKISNGKLKELGIKEGFILLTANDMRLTSPNDLIKIVNDLLKQDPDDRGLDIKGLYPNDRGRFYAIDLNN
jgi:S1-C subfamily serine protease